MVDTAGGSIAISWGGGQSGITSDITKTATGNAQYPSVIDMVPPPQSAASFWIGASGSGIVFSLNGNSNTTNVDLWFVALIGSSSRTITISSTATAATVYYLPLDGPGASPNFPATHMTLNIS